MIGIIPAREGSKRLKNKNIIDLGGRPLIAWTIEAALKSNLNHVIVSTDSKEIREIAKTYGAEVPFLRPKELATDISHTIDVMIHCIDNILYKSSDIMLLQPTSPFRTHIHINGSIDLYNKNKTCSCISVCKIDFPPEWSIDLGDKKLKFPFWERNDSPFNVERQQLPIYYKPNGAIYITNVEYLKRERNLININDCGHYIMDSESSFDIDTEIDYKIAKEMIK